MGFLRMTLSEGGCRGTIHSSRQGVARDEVSRIRLLKRATVNNRELGPPETLNQSGQNGHFIEPPFRGRCLQLLGRSLKYTVCAKPEFLYILGILPRWGPHIDMGRKFSFFVTYSQLQLLLFD